MPTQVLVDDEWHMVHRLRDSASLSSLLTDFGTNDHSIGLALCSWLMMHVTTADELLLRTPSLAAGVLLVVLVPMLVARAVEREIAVVLAWILAVSPLLCFFSRLARPYALITLLVGVAVLSFHRWFATAGGSRAARRIYLVSAVLAPLFHLAALPAVLAPFLLAAVIRRDPRPTAGQVGRLLLASLAAIGLVLALPWAHGSATVLSKMHADHLPLQNLPQLFELMTGSGAHCLMMASLGLTAAGIAALWQRARLLTLHILAVSTVQIAVIVGSRPLALHVPIVAARYFVMILPLLLIFPAAALVRALRVRGDLGASLLGAATAAVLLWSGPLAWIYEAPNDFTNHISYQADYVPGRYFERFRPHQIPAFYRAVLGTRAPGSVTIVEAPWYFYFHSFAYLQRIHRQHVLIGFVDEHPTTTRVGELAATEPSIRLRRAVRLDDRIALRSRHVDFVVLHRNVLAETRWPTGVIDVAVDMTAWEARYRSWFGAPVFDDGQIVVFAVAARPVPRE